MTNTQILALARVFDQEWTEYMAKAEIAAKFDRGVVKGAADMWATLHAAIAREIYNMHGNRGELLFKNYATALQSGPKGETGR